MKPRQWILNAVSALVLAAAVWAGQAIPAAEIPKPKVDPVNTRTSVACPVIDAGSETVVQQADLLAPGGELQATPVSGGQTQTGEHLMLTQTAPVRVQASRGAPFGGIVWLNSQEGAERGLSGAWCAAAAAELWFAGVRSSATAQAQVLLVNLDHQEAVADLAVYAQNGQVVANGSRGIKVPADSSRLVPLSSMLTETEAFTVQVRNTAGRVAAFVRQRSWNGTTISSDWIPAAAAPDTTTVIPGIAPAESYALTVANPGKKATSVEIQFLSGEGASAIVGFESLDVPAETTRTLTLDGGLIETAGGLRLTASEPVTAAVRMVSVSGKNADEAYSAAQSPAPASYAFTAVEGTQAVIVNPGAEQAMLSISGVAEGETGQTVTVPPNSSLVLDFPAGQQVGLRGDYKVGAALVVTRKLGKLRGLAVVPLAPPASNESNVEIVYNPRVG
ncbi:MAG: DUF5719 family protein [Propionibacteriaceae bacterium]|nr:DUF5719 family protein [Propionibacteriaceae bacterium]